MSSTRSYVLSGRVWYFSSLPRAIRTHVNRDTTSKDTIISSSPRAWIAYKLVGIQRRQLDEGGHPACAPSGGHTIVVYFRLSFSGMNTHHQGVNRFRLNSMLFMFLSKGDVGSFFTGQFALSSLSIVSILAS